LLTLIIIKTSERGGVITLKTNPSTSHDPDSDGVLAQDLLHDYVALNDKNALFVSMTKMTNEERKKLKQSLAILQKNYKRSNWLELKRLELEPNCKGFDFGKADNMTVQLFTQSDNILPEYIKKDAISYYEEGEITYVGSDDVRRYQLYIKRNILIAKLRRKFNYNDKLVDQIVNNLTIDGRGVYYVLYDDIIEKYLSTVIDSTILNLKNNCSYFSSNALSDIKKMIEDVVIKK
jgi:hypothetical protein